MLQLLILILFVSPTVVLAYVDPGSIAILLQMLVAWIIGLSIAFRGIVINTIKKIFNIKKSDDVSGENDPEEAEKLDKNK